MEPGSWDSELSCRLPLAPPGSGDFAERFEAMRAIASRLQKLERRFPPCRAIRPGPSAAEKISGWLAQNGIARGESESLMATLARALGVTMSELRMNLQRRAAGQHAELATDIGT
jgi:hypothetical protein